MPETMPETYPLLCSDAVSRNIRAGKQTQDRRPVTPRTCLWPNWRGRWTQEQAAAALEAGWVFPRIEAGDLLYVRETWAPGADARGTRFDDPVLYRADFTQIGSGWWRDRSLYGGDRWRPSIHMRKADARTIVRVTRVWLERCGAISPEDAVSEGFDSVADFLAYMRGAYGDDVDARWVVACAFEVASLSGWDGVEVSP